MAASTARVRALILLMSLAPLASADNVLRETATGLSDGRTPGQLLGGNVNTRPNRLASSLEAIDFYAEINLGTVRVATNPGQFWVGGVSDPTPNPNDPTTETIVDYAISNGLNPYLLINYRPVIHGGSWNDISQQQWYDLGREYALEYQDRVSTYTFINEPDNFDTLIDAEDYAVSLESFADGVHSVSVNLNVSTGGFATIANRATSTDFLSAISPLVESGDVFALNIHTYNSLTRADRRIGDGTNDASANSIFAEQKAIAGITGNIPYAAAEWNLRNTDDANNDLAAEEFLTAMWDHLGVVGDGGNNDHKTEFATVFQLRLDDPTKGHALADQVEPQWDGNERGDVFEMVVDIAHDTAFKEVRPIDDGYYILEKPLEKKIWVLQNRTGWRSDGSTLTTTVAGIPAWASELELWYWDGLASTVPTTAGVDELMVGIRPEETVMIVARADFLEGDYNLDGLVDATDYGLWRDSLNQSGDGLPTDANRDGVVDQLDYAVWRSSYGATGGSGSLPAATAVAPEPATGVGFAISAALLGGLSSQLRRVGLGEG